MYMVNPDGRVVVFLRNPVDRAYAQWAMATKPGWGETRAFGQCIRDECGKLSTGYVDEFYSCERSDIAQWREGYVLKGFYIDQLRSLLRFFPKEHVYISISERVRANIVGEYNRIFAFLGVEPFEAEFELRFPGHYKSAIGLAESEELRSIYELHNESLFNFLGYEVDEWL
jgi:hypothetical protein